MLTYLGVKGFAIIDELRIEFGEGFNVITGETGAGKSIVINALSTLMNAKSTPDAVRTDSQQAEVTGHFLGRDAEYVLKRIIGNSGRSRAFLDDEPITLAKMENLGSSLISVYGQNDFQHLLDKSNYPAILDKLLGFQYETEKLAAKVDELKKVNTELSAVKREAEGKDREITLLQFQIDEINSVKVGHDEEETLKERLKVLKNGEKIFRMFDDINEGLIDSDSSAHSILKSFSGSLKGLGQIGPLENFREKIDTITYEIEDLCSDIHAFKKTIIFTEDEMLKVEDRLSEIFKTKDKYGNSLEEIGSFREKADERLTYLKGITDEIDLLSKLQGQLEETVQRMALYLSDKRKKGSPGIEKIIIDELGFLSMNGLKFRISINDTGHIDRDGRDEIELLISTNPGEPLKPLRKIASGGELSRIMLAIKKVIGGEEEKVLIFDEVDAGIGGRIADLVGKRLRDLSARHQILCITHLPQIAAYGDKHFVVEKKVISGRTRTAIRELDPDERVHELARMLGGRTITDITIERAREMLDS